MRALIVFGFILSFNLCCCEESCVIDIDCDDCLPENLPVINSHFPQNSLFQILHGDEIHLQCHRTKFLNYPDKNIIKAVCDNGNYRVINDSLFVKHISELGCEADHFDDVLHEVDYCRNPFQGRSYQYRSSFSSATIHLAEVCYDSDLGQTIFTHMSLSNGNNIVKNEHIDNQNTFSILGNFNMMFDKSNTVQAEKIYDNDVSLNKKFKFMLGKDKFNFADQSLISVKFLPSSLFFNQFGRVTKFASNKVAVWKSIAQGNLKSLHKDIVNGFKRDSNNFNNNTTLDVYSGTHGILSLQMGNKYQEIYLKPGKKYPVPKYLWSIIHNKSERQAIALVIVNNPFISISEIRNTIFCPSMCNSISWIKNLMYNNNYERSAYGLVFCCDMHSFAKVVRDSPNILANVHTVLKDGLP